MSLNLTQSQTEKNNMIITTYNDSETWYKKCFKEINPLIPRPEGGGLLGADPEQRVFTSPSNEGLDAAERVNEVNSLDRGFNLYGRLRIILL